MAVNAQDFEPGHFINRELSWLEFNQRVLDEAIDPTTPLLERLKFFAITSSNLDEFFEVRVAGLKQAMESELPSRSVDGLTASETFAAVVRRVRKMVDQQYRCWRDQLQPSLAKHGIRVIKIRDLKAPDFAFIDQLYREQIRLVLTPLGIDTAHPFPQLLNKSLNLIVELEITQQDQTELRMAVVQIPRSIPRLVRLPGPNSRREYIFLGDLIGANLPDLFPGTKIKGWWRFRVTRNSELYIDEEDTANLLRAVEDELHNRRKGAAVRLELEKGCSPEIQQRLMEHLRLKDDDVYLIDGPINPTRLMTLYEGDHSPELRDPPHVAPVAARLRDQDDIFAAVRERDVLLHHPYESFDSVIQFLAQAAVDPKVLAIKQTLYRTGGDPRIVGALMQAVRNGKQVTAVVELKARFDEANNIEWARRLEESGVHVVYGLVGLKIHAKVTLVVRRDPDAIRRYVHLSTGNYNAATAKLYTDVGILTCRPDYGEDATNLFNLLTGICQFQGMRKYLVAPFELHDQMLALINREAENAQKGLPARIIARMNSLVDDGIIRALYRASQAGVRIDLIVRGICCLRPGVKAVSENITVRSIVDRFLEHPRIFYFENACKPAVFLGSADWMPRNFFRRIEIIFPVEDGVLRDRVINEILELPLTDNLKARVLKADGTYQIPKRKKGVDAVRSQESFIKLAASGKRRAATKAGKKTRYQSVKLAPKPEALN